MAIDGSSLVPGGVVAGGVVPGAVPGAVPGSVPGVVPGGVVPSVAEVVPASPLNRTSNRSDDTSVDDLNTRHLPLPPSLIQPNGDFFQFTTNNTLSSSSSLVSLAALNTNLQSEKVRMQVAITRAQSRVARAWGDPVSTRNWFGRWSALVSPSLPDFQCAHMERWGSFMDGGWVVCLDGPYNLALSSPGTCLVYSFGLSNNWSWDYDVLMRTRCECHGFDHTVSTGVAPPAGEPPGDSAKDSEKTAFLRNAFNGYRKMSHGSTYKFHPYGLSSQDSDKPPLRTLDNLVKYLGHEERHIDYLKVDIEGAEWKAIFLREATFQLVTRRVKQVGLELHPDWNNQRDQATILVTKLLQAGFVIAASTMNPWHNNLREVVLLNCRYLLNDIMVES